MTSLLRRLHAAVAHVAQCCEQVNAVMKALQGGDVDADIVARWDEGCEAVGLAMKKVETRRKEAKVGGTFG